MKDSESLLLKMLLEIHDELSKKLSQFPRNCCSGAAVELYKNFGFLWVLGSFTGTIAPDYKGEIININGFRSAHHNVSYDPVSGYYMDITSAQFDPSAPKVVLLHESDKRLAFRESEVDQNTLYLVREIGVPKHLFGGFHTHIPTRVYCKYDPPFHHD